MESRKLIYLNGHFYDPATRQRVQPRDGAEFLLIGDQARDLPYAPPAGNYVADVRTLAELTAKARHYGLGYKALELLPLGTTLRFTYPNPHYPATDPYYFGVQLREPLLLIAPLQAATPTQPKDYGGLFECRCVVLPLEHDARLRFTEPVFADSLNEALKNTYVHYFGNDGSPGRSAFNVCRVLDGDSLQYLREQAAPTLWQQPA